MVLVRNGRFLKDWLQIFADETQIIKFIARGHMQIVMVGKQIVANAKHAVPQKDLRLICLTVLVE